jgi:homogentisate 1,2-dioxygenase
MPLYHKLGSFPQKRHTQFEKPNGGLYYEQLFGTEGFHGHSSLLYHVHRPTQVKEINNSYSVEPKIAIGKNIKSLLLKGFELKPEADFLDSRKPMLVNRDCIIGLAAPQESLRTYFYKNADADEMLFIHKGKGKLRTMMGNISFEYGDYLIIPRGMIYQIDFETAENRLFYVESYTPFYTPKRYKNNSGQHLEHSPFCERDFKLPSELETYDERKS